MCDGVPLDPIAAQHGTPLYVYSASTIAARYRAIDEAFTTVPHAIHYALKANSTLAIPRLLRGLGSAAPCRWNPLTVVWTKECKIPDYDACLPIPRLRSRRRRTA